MTGNIASLLPADSKNRRRLVSDYAVLANTFCKVLEILMGIKSKGPSVDPTVVTEDDIKGVEQIFSFEPEDLKPIFDKNSVGPFWLTKAGQQEKLTFAWLTTVLPASCGQRMRFMFSRSTLLRQMLQDAITAPILRLKQSMTKLDRFPLKQLIAMQLPTDDIDLKSVAVPRSSEWVLSVKDRDSPAVLEKSSQTREGSVRCLLVTPKRTGSAVVAPLVSDSKSLIFHIHGGAFMLGKPEMLLFILNKYSKAVRVPILSVDYAKAPEHKYPAGLQDTLDAYMAVTSGASWVQELLGYHPSNVIVTGESSGGNFAILLAILLRMIQETGCSVVMPVGLSPLFPCSVPGPIASPSISMFSYDIALPVSAMANVFAEYPPLDPPAHPGWHRREGRKEVLEQLKSRVKDPLFNALAGTHIDQLKDVKLSIIACEFDPILDNSVSIARRWSAAGGEVRFRIAKSMAHGFVRKSGEVEEEIKWITDGMTQHLFPKTGNPTDSKE